MANKKPSIEELKSKAEGGDVESQKMLGDIYLTPRLQYGFIKPNKNEGIKWYRLAADQGDVDAMFIVGKLLWSTTTLSIHYLKKAAELGHSEARYRLAMQCFKAGNQVEAVRHYEIAMDDSKLDISLRADCAFNVGASYDFENEPEIYIAIEYYEQAYEWGNSKAAYNLGRIYEEGCTVIEYGTPTTEYEVIKRDLKKASHWYLKSAEMGYSDGMHRCAEWYKHGNGFLKNYEKAFDWILKAACHDQKYCANLSEYFQYGIGVDENIYEAYVWAVIAGKHFRAKALSVLENTLPKKEVLRAQREAEKRVKICENYSLDGAAKGRDLYNYMREVLKNRHPAVSETTGKDHKAEITGGANVQKTPAELPVSPDSDPDPSPGIAYSYLSVCKKHFNPELVTLELVVPRKLKKTETLDFTRLKISYDGRNTDAKNREVLTPFRINRAERQLLIRLAAQFSVADPERRAAAIQKILSASRESTRVSHLNAMFRAIFHGCAKTRDERMINRQSGYIAPKLKIDTTKITNARDYPLCGL